MVGLLFWSRYEQAYISIPLLTLDKSRSALNEIRIRIGNKAKSRNPQLCGFPLGIADDLKQERVNRV